MSPKAVLSLPRSRQPHEEPVPYLIAHGAPALRFERPTPTPDLSTRPVAAAPPNPALTLTESTVAQANLAAVQPALPRAQTDQPPPEAPAKYAPPPTRKPPPAILPDDTRPTIRPEDFLPFFQIPGSAPSTGGASVIVPVPMSPPAGITPPPSSATYTQTPK